MSECLVEAKRDFFGSPLSVATPSNSTSTSSSPSPLHLHGANRDQNYYSSDCQLSRRGPFNDGLALGEAVAVSVDGRETPLLEAEAVYEQPMPRAAPQLAAAARQTNASKLSTFKAPPRPAERATYLGRRLSASAHDSLESVRSNLSSSSASNELHLERPNHKQIPQSASKRPSLVRVGTRRVSPPALPTDGAPQPASQQDKTDGWQTIALNDIKDDQRRASKTFCRPGSNANSNILFALKSQNGAVSSPKQVGLSMSDLDGSPTNDEPGKRASLAVVCKMPNGEKGRPGDSDKPATGGKQAQIGKQKPPFMFAGIIGSILGSIFFSFGILTIKLLPDGHGFAEKTKIACWRGATMMVLCAVSIMKSRCGFLVPRDEIFINVLRSIFGFMGIYMAYMALKYISMGDSTALVFSSPVWTSLLSHYILHEPLRWIQLLALPMSLLGIVLIAHPSLLINIEHRAGPLERQPVLDVVDVILDQPTTANELDLHNGTNRLQQLINGTISTLNQDIDIAMDATEHFDYEHRWKGIVIALACSFVVSLVYIVLKFRKSTPIQTATFWLAFTTFSGSLFLGLFVGFGEFPTKPSEIALLLFNGICSWLGQCFLQWALAYEDASVLSVVRTLDVAMSFSLSAIFLDEEILWTSILGASIIAAVVVSIMLSNYIQSKLCSPKAEDDSQPSASQYSSQSEYSDQDLVQSKKTLADRSCPYLSSTPNLSSASKRHTVGA